MRNVIAVRAGAALDRLYPGPHRDKLIARDFGVSVRMAQYLRTGQHWTIDHLAQASALLGAAFDRALYSPAQDQQHFDEMGDISSRLGRLEAWRGDMAGRAEAGLAPPERVAVDGSGRAAGGADGTPDCEGAPP
jgi:hypothetical protein